MKKTPTIILILAILLTAIPVHGGTPTLAITNAKESSEGLSIHEDVKSKITTEWQDYKGNAIIDNKLDCTTDHLTKLLANIHTITVFDTNYVHFTETEIQKQVREYSELLKIISDLSNSP